MTILLYVPVEQKSDLQIFLVLRVKYSSLSGLVVVPDNRETRTSFPLVKRLDLSVLFVTCHPRIMHKANENV